ncbi:hypothetical protein DFJ73DRAFT_755667 [Zopfochytrium polystomum]|nr:hypothetical protein DFJ73DRAFT_755667 [Zopfochytrium polystomum]
MNTLVGSYYGCYGNENDPAGGFMDPGFVKSMTFPLSSFSPTACTAYCDTAYQFFVLAPTTDAAATAATQVACNCMDPLDPGWIYDISNVDPATDDYCSLALSVDKMPAGGRNSTGGVSYAVYQMLYAADVPASSSAGAAQPVTAMPAASSSSAATSTSSPPATAGAAGAATTSTAAGAGGTAQPAAVSTTTTMSLGIGAIAGIGVGAAVVVAAVGFGVFYWLRARRERMAATRGSVPLPGDDGIDSLNPAPFPALPITKSVPQHPRVHSPQPVRPHQKRVAARRAAASAVAAVEGFVDARVQQQGRVVGHAARQVGRCGEAEDQAVPLERRAARVGLQDERENAGNVRRRLAGGVEEKSSARR